MLQILCGGARANAAKLKPAELTAIETRLNFFRPDGLDEAKLNEMFWHDFEHVCQLIGTTAETVLARGQDGDETAEDEEEED